MESAGVINSDITIIGAGPGGYVAAIQGAKLGAKVVLIEKDKVGGTCLNRGCIPTKALVRSAEVYESLKNAKDFGCIAQDVGVDMAAVIDRKDQIVGQLVRGIEHLLKKNQVTLLTGTAQLQDAHTVIVDDGGGTKTTVQSKNIIIATGSNPIRLPIPGSDLPQVMDSTEALETKELPKSLAIIGGGIIGMEFAFIYASFGVEVSVIEFLDDILSMLDTDLRRQIALSARRAGIKLYTGARAEAIEEAEDGGCVLSFTHKGEVKSLSVDRVLVAVGRRPNLGGLELKRIGIELNDSRRGIKVNNRMQTNIPHIYAVGDVTDRIQLAHVASQQGIVAVENIVGNDVVMDYSAVPNALFTQPEIATVGLSEAEAKAQGIDYQVGTFPFAANGKALTYGTNRGMVKVITEKSSGKIIGAGIIGPQATELIAELTLAVKQGLTAADIAATIHAHPTVAEAVHEASLATKGLAIHI
ncbi:MAG: dihydrolipoyl dehydrogenase [Firmicutes bacterium]|nr:dihydrolipoyl dehydrogenase [Bacillota bacterium]